MKIKFIYLIMFFILGIVSVNFGFSDYYSRGIDFLKNSEKFQKKNNLILSGYGINTNRTIETPIRNSIHQFDIMFNSKEQLQLKDARRRLIECIEFFLQEINNCREIRKYLNEYPFNYKGLNFSIAFDDGINNSLKSHLLSMCYSKGDKLYYVICNSDNSFEVIHEETYEEALKIVESEKNN